MSKAIEYKMCNRYGCIYEYITENIDNKNHSYNDEPACVLMVMGWYYSYYINGEWHRDDAPAIIHANDHLGYYNRGILYRPKCQKL